MMSVDTADAQIIVLPTSMQTLLDRYPERTLTSQERRALAVAAPNVRCEALRILFELNNAAAAVEYVLANSGVPQKSSRSTSSISAVAADSYGASRRGAPKALGSLNANTPLLVKRSPEKPAMAAARQPHALSPPAKHGLASGVGQRCDGSEDRDRHSTSVATVPSPYCKGKSRSRRGGAALRGDSVDSLVTVSSMSSGEFGSEEARCWGERSSSVAAVVTAREALPSTATPGELLESTLTSRTRGNGSAGILTDANGSCGLPPSVNSSPSLTNTPCITPAVAGGAPLAGVCTATQLEAKATRRRGSSSASDGGNANEAEAEPRKTVAAKVSLHHGAPATALAVSTAAAGATAQRISGSHVAFTDAKALAVLNACRSNCIPELQPDDVELAYTELSYRHSSLSPSCASASAVGNLTDRAALLEAASAPTLPPGGRTTLDAPAEAERSLATATAVKASASAVGVRTPCVPTLNLTAVANARCTQRDGASCSSGGGHPLPSPPSLPIPQVDHQRLSRGSDAGAVPTSRKTRQSTTDETPSLPAYPSTLAAPPVPDQDHHHASSSPIKHCAAWDEQTRTYITHPNQRRRLAAPAGTATAATLSLRQSPAVCAVGASALAAPDTLRYFFCRTASTLRKDGAATSLSASTAGERAAQPTPAPTSFGRLRSAAPLLTRPPATCGSAPSRKTSDTCVAASHDSTASAATTAEGSSTPTTRKKKAKMVRVRDPPSPAVLTKPRVGDFQRLRTGYTLEKGEARRGLGEEISYQQFASRYHPTLSTHPALERRHATPNRTAAGAMTSWLSRTAATPPSTRPNRLSHGGLEVDGHTAPRPTRKINSAARTPQTARPRTRGRPQHSRGTAQEAAAPPPSARQNVFERLTSTYYGAHSTARTTTARPTIAGDGDEKSSAQGTPFQLGRSTVAKVAAHRRPKFAVSETAGPSRQQHQVAPLTRWEVMAGPSHVHERDREEVLYSPSSGAGSDCAASRYLKF